MPFNRFLDLPLELRLKVWWYSFVPRVVVLLPTDSAETDQSQWYSSSPNQAGLSVCFEARAEALKAHTVTIPVINGIRPVINGIRPVINGIRPVINGICYINPALDTLVLLGRYNDDQLSNIFYTVRPQRIWLSVAGSAFTRNPLPRGKHALFPDLEELVVLLNSETVSSADFFDCKSNLEDCGAIDRFVGYVTNTNEFQSEGGKDGIHMMSLSHIPSAISVPGHEVMPKAEAFRIDTTIRFGERTMSYKFGELDKFFSLLASVSTAFARTPPRLELFFSKTEPKRPSQGILQISTGPLEAVHIKEMLDSWRFYNNDVKFEYIAEEERVTIRQLENQNRGYVHSVRNVSVGADKWCFRLVDGSTDNGVDGIETIVRHAMQAVEPAARPPLQPFQSPTVSTLTRQNRAPQVPSMRRTGGGGLQIIGSISEQALTNLLAEL